MIKVTGRLSSFGEVQSFGPNFTKRTFVIVTDEQYPQSIQLELHGDKTDLIDKYRIGDTLECDIKIRGRAWKNSSGEVKYFNTLVSWQLKLLEEGADGKIENLVDPSIPF